MLRTPRWSHKCLCRPGDRRKQKQVRVARLTSAEATMGANCSEAIPQAPSCRRCTHVNLCLHWDGGHPAGEWEGPAAGPLLHCIFDAT